MRLSKYPIIEFDETTNVLIDVTKNLHSEEPLPTACVISYFGEAVRQYIKENNGVQCGKLVLETFELPLYKVIVFNTEVVILHGLGSGPYAAGQMEKLIAMGCRQFMVCGGCGVLSKGSKRGQVYIPVKAVRDEGTSYHYVKPSREIDLPSSVKEQVASFLKKRNISYSCVKTWTTDAMYRETLTSVAFRKQEGCDVVEMECASLYAVAEYKQVPLGLLLYAGDDISGKVWDSRDWKSDHGTRFLLLDLAVQLVPSLKL